MFGRRRYGSRKYKDIDPDEIFLDSQNAPDFDVHQLEGRLEKPISKWAPRLVSIFFLLVILGFSTQLFSLQHLNSNLYVDRSENNHLRHEIIFADRGIVYDRNGTELIWNEPNLEEKYSIRKYSSQSGLAHVLGYVGYPQKDDKGYYYQDEFVGKDGVEEGFSDIIAGKNGIKISERDVFSEIVSESTTLVPQNGKDLILSIDSRVQHNLYEYIRNLALSAGFKGGAGVIMDVKTGEVIAMTSYPEYSSQVLTDGVDIEKIESYVNHAHTPFLNRATLGLYTPGSIVKPYVAVGALNEGVISESKKIVSTGSIRIQNPYNPELFTIFTDWKAHGAVDVRDALAVSSNIYFYEVGGGFEDQLGLGIEKIESYIRAFGVGERTGLEGISEVDGVIPNPEWKAENFEDGDWRLGDTYNTAIGQYGFQVTAIQMARAVAGIATDGVIVKPKIEMNQKTEITEVDIDIDNKYIEITKEGMRQCVTDGICRGLDLSFIDVAAKTGTAELGVSKQSVNSWVIGFFTYNEPKYSFAVVMEKGSRENLTGAVFVVRNLLEWMSLEVPEYVK